MKTIFSNLLTLSSSQTDIQFKELLKGGAIAFILKIIGLLFGYTSILLITHNFGASAMGIFTLSITILSIFSIVGRLGLDTALLRFVAEYSSQNKPHLIKEVYIKVIKIVIPASLVISFWLFFLSPYVARHIFHKEYLIFYLRIVSFAILPMILTLINSQALRALKKIKEFSFFQNISNPFFTSIFLMVFLVFTREKALPVISYALALAASAALSQISWQKNAKLSSVQYEKTIKFKNILDISIPMMLSSSMSFIMNWTAIIMLGMFKTDVEVGVFNVAERIATFTSITLVAINSIAAPKFAEFYGKNDVKGLEKIAKQSNKLIFWTALPIMAVIFLFPSFILGIFGEEFKTGFYALIILTVGQFINAISGSVVSILQMTGKEKVFQNIMVIATLLNVVLNAVLIPRYGIIGAALANMLSMSLWNLSSLIYIKLYLNIVTLYIPIISKDLIFWRK
jgi:O-antigen/teichoic acid export membrane protein